jgi:VWFA-related protein
MIRTAGVLAVALAAGAVSAQDSVDTPRDLGLTERATARLAQIDVSLDGPRETISSMTESDFEIWVAGKKIEKFLMDRLCAAPEEGRSVGAGALRSTSEPVEAPSRPRTTFVFYFDQSHLTAPGRQGAIDAARVMIPRFVTGGSQGMIVSNASSLRTLQPLTDDPEVLLAALEAMENDRLEWDPYTALEEVRLNEVLRLASENVDDSLILARRYQAEERWRQARDLRRLSMVLGALAEFRPPKAFVYFADAMRANAGEHYLSFFGSSVLDAETGSSKGADRLARTDAESGALSLDKVINDASALGIRFYTVEAQGLTASANPISAQRGIGVGGNNALNSSRIRDAQGTLKDMALETGGEAFLNGVPASKMADRILEDVSCLYLLSFDPAGLPLDEPLAVRVHVDRPKVKVQHRGRLVLSSEASMLTTRLLARFATPDAKGNDVALRVGLMPVGFRDGKWLARVQVAAPPVAYPLAKWDLGVSLVSRGTVRDDASGRIEVATSGAPVVLESDLSFRPGPYEIVAVAYENTADQSASRRVEGEWPDPDAALVSFGPLSVSQPAKGAYLRDGDSRTSGTLAYEENDPLRPELPTAFLGLLCRAKDQKRGVRVVRTLVGTAETPIKDETVEFGGERCVQILDVIQPRTFGPGAYEYRAVALGPEGELARLERRLLVASPETASVQPTPRGNP